MTNWDDIASQLKRSLSAVGHLEQYDLRWSRNINNGDVEIKCLRWRCTFKKLTNVESTDLKEAIQESVNHAFEHQKG